MAVVQSGIAWVMLPLAWMLGGSLCGAASAQERVASAGRVLDASREPVAGATVTFVGSDPPTVDRFEPADAIEVVTDDHGRFRVELRARCQYAGWAAGVPDATGARMVSRTVRVLPGSGFELTLRSRAEPTPVTIAGLDAWSDIGPLQVAVSLTHESLHRLPIKVLDGVVHLPPKPVDRDWLLFANDRDGRALSGT